MLYLFKSQLTSILENISAINNSNVLSEFLIEDDVTLKVAYNKGVYIGFIDRVEFTKTTYEIWLDLESGIKFRARVEKFDTLIHTIRHLKSTFTDDMVLTVNELHMCAQTLYRYSKTLKQDQQYVTNSK